MKEFYRFSSVGSLCLCLIVFNSFRVNAQLTARYISTSSNSGGFYEYLPAGYSTSGSTFPLMVFIQGQGEHGNGTTDLSRVLDNGAPHLISQGTFPSSFTVNGQTFSFIVITPQFITTPTETDIDAVINYAKANYKVDANRVYLTGLSEGGGMVWAYAGYSSSFASKVAAIQPICGAIGINDQQAHNIAAGNVPVYATHNLNDPTVPSHFTADNVNAVNGATPPPAIPAVYTIFNASGHDAWTHTDDPSFLNPDIGNLNVYQWMLQYSRGSSTPLPVTLLSYTAAVTADGAQVNIDWTTGVEQSNNYFIIQRSADGTTFTDLDTVAAAAAPGLGHSYVYTDASPLTGNDFYRLVQVDQDGKTTFYGVLKVTIGASGKLDLQISPNPSPGLVYLHLVHPETGTLLVNLTDMDGRTVRVWTLQKTQEVWDQSIDLSGLSAGSYVLQIRGTTIREVRTIIKR